MKYDISRTCDKRDIVDVNNEKIIVMNVYFASIQYDIRAEGLK